MEKIIDIQVRSRVKAKEFTSDLPWAAISISTDEADFPELKRENRVGLLQIAFWDSEFNRSEVGNYFKVQHSEKILDFVREQLPKIECLLIHCEMGMSRSPAVAAALSYILWGPRTDTIYFQKYTPNMLVYSTLLQLQERRQKESNLLT
jgi:predicted protein tyrosine phosphatase